MKIRIIVALTICLSVFGACDRQLVDPGSVNWQIGKRMFKYIKEVNESGGDPERFFDVGVKPLLIGVKRDGHNVQFKISNRELLPLERKIRYTVMAKQRKSDSRIQGNFASFEVVWRQIEDGNWLIVSERRL